MSDELYGAAIKDLAARESMALDRPDATSSLDNPLCGDRVSLGVTMEDGRVTAMGHQVKGCLLCKAAATLVAEQAVGLEADGAVQLLEQVSEMLKKGADPAFPSLGVFLPVRLHKSRHDCVLLPFKALAKAIRIP
jgi:NifU-like protein involved in Fe-S cluster formation